MNAVNLVILNTVRNTAEWMGRAVCASADPEEWFPEKGSSSEIAKRICGDCPVVNECLQFALENGEHGIWGGTSHRERLHLIRRAS